MCHNTTLLNKVIHVPKQMQITILFILFQKKSKIIQKPCQVVHFCKHNEMESIHVDFSIHFVEYLCLCLSVYCHSLFCMFVNEWK